MEEKSKSQLNLSMSNWKLKQQTIRNMRNFRQLGNRLVILQMERQAKVKSIERKLDHHRKLIEVRMERHKLKQELERHEQSINESTGINSRVFKDIRLKRAFNIRSKSNQFTESNHQWFQQVKEQRKLNEQLIKNENERDVMNKTEKRNRVRLIEIQSKENVSKFWKGRLSQIRTMKEGQMAKRLEGQSRKLAWLVGMEKSEQELLAQIKRAEQMEEQLVSMMEEEKSMVDLTINNTT